MSAAIDPDFVPPRHVPCITQDWHAYTSEDHSTWAKLWERRMRTLRQTGARAVLDGLDAIGLTPSSLPRIDALNARLSPRTGWEVVAVEGYLDARDFFALLAQRRFPSTTHLRPADALDYIPAPDIFHDVFGHVPLHADPVFADLLQRFGQIGTRARSTVAVTAVQRLFWFTVEFGLVREGGAPRLYGSGQVSSIAEERHALGDTCDRRRFDLDAVLATGFDVDRVQPVLFVLEDFRELHCAVEALAGRISADEPVS